MENIIFMEQSVYTAELILPKGMLGPEHDYLIDGSLRAIGEHFAEEGSWGEKYGTNVVTPVFSMHRFCWCDGENCPWCWDEDTKEPQAPNFHYKPLDFKVWWYKYIGRDMTFNRSISIPECAFMLTDCLHSLPFTSHD